MLDGSKDPDGIGVLINVVAHSSRDNGLLKILLSAGIDPDQPMKNDFRPSHVCGQNGLLAAAEAIFLCRPDMKAMNSNDHTPLQAASYNYAKVGSERLRCTVMDKSVF